MRQIRRYSVVIGIDSGSITQTVTIGNDVRC